VEQVYLQLELAWKVSDMMQDALKTAKATYKFTNDRYGQGLVQKSDVLNVQVRVKDMETRCEEAKANIANASDLLGLLMNRQQGVIYHTQSPDFEVKGDTARVLPESRADFKAIQSAMESYSYLIRSSRAGNLPKINAFGDYQLHDKRLSGFDANGYLVGIQLSWDVFKGFQTLHKTNVLVLEREKLSQQLEDTKNRGQAELSKAQRDFMDAIFKIRQQAEATDQATEALRILQNRYEQGLVTTTDVLQAQTQLSQQKLAYAQAIFERNSSWIYIEFLTISKP
jgi:outer membrane protein TolC